MKTPIQNFLRICLVLFFLGNGTPSLGRETTTLGAADCKDWLDVTSLPVGDPKYMLRTARQFWAIGYVTAANRYLEINRNLLEHVNGATVSAWMDTYCKKNPKSSLAETLDALILKLIELK